jgi:type IV pilus assembly protein PilM
MTESVLTRFFPVPKILTRHATALDLSSASLKIIELAKNNSELKVVRSGEVVFPEGTISGGEIENRDALKAALIEAKKTYHLDRVVLSLPEEKSYLFMISIPYISEKELRGVIELKLEEYVPLPPENIIFDYEIIRYRPTANELDISVAVLPRALVVSYIDVLREAGISVMRLYPEAGAVARAIIPHANMQPTMIIDFGHSRTGISIVEGKYVLFNTILEFGAIDITRAVMKDFNVSYEEAEKLKREKGVREEGEKNLFSSALSSLAVLKDEIHKYHTYWNDRATKEKSGGKIEHMIFSGGGSALNGLQEFLASYIDVPFSVANPWVNVFSLEKEIPAISRNDALRFATAIGLALIEHDSMNYD